MACIKRFLVISFVLVLSGCSTFARKDLTFESGYRMGVRENMQDFTQSFYGNDFPYFYWESQVVQTVKIPAHIENGLFIPEHNEPVVIDPGQWRKSASYPISCPKEEKKINKKEGGEPYAFSYLNFSTRDLTVFPESFTCAKPGAKDKDSR